MALISETVRKNAMKCEECAFLKMGTSVDKNSVLYEEALSAAKGMLQISCSMCPNSKDFEKMHGKKPFEYYAELITRRRE